MVMQQEFNSDQHGKHCLSIKYQQNLKQLDFANKCRDRCRRLATPTQSDSNRLDRGRQSRAMLHCPRDSSSLEEICLYLHLNIIINNNNNNNTIILIYHHLFWKNMCHCMHSTLNNNKFSMGWHNFHLFCQCFE
jgi:hypothetical protein